MIATHGGTRVVADLISAGPGHFSALDLRLPERGEWIMRISATVDGERVSVSGAITTR